MHRNLLLVLLWWIFALSDIEVVAAVTHVIFLGTIWRFSSWEPSSCEPGTFTIAPSGPSYSWLCTTWKSRWGWDRGLSDEIGTCNVLIASRHKPASIWGCYSRLSAALLVFLSISFTFYFLINFGFECQYCSEANVCLEFQPLSPMGHDAAGVRIGSKFLRYQACLIGIWEVFNFSVFQNG